MAVITNYSTLQTEVASTLARDDLTSYIPQFIQFAENKLYRSLNLRNEETALSVSITSGAAAVPSDFKALKYAYFDEAPIQILTWVSPQELYRDYPNRTNAGTPSVITREGSNFIFGPASKNGTLKGIYYAKQDPLRTTDPSWYVTNAPEVLLYGALLEASPFIMGDDRIGVWRSFYDEAVDTLRQENENAEHAWSVLTQRAS